MGWPRAGSALVGACVVLCGCGTFSGATRVDVGPMARSLEAQLGITLERVTPPRGHPGVPALRATFSGGDDRQRVTVLEFFEPEGIAQALGPASVADATTVLRRHNLAVLYTRTAGPDHRRDLERALESAPLVTGLPPA